MMNSPAETSNGRPVKILGDVNQLPTKDWQQLLGRLDEDPRICSASVMPIRDLGRSGTWLRLQNPSSTLVAVALDVCDLVGFAPASMEEVAGWADCASARGLWHDCLMVDHDRGGVDPDKLGDDDERMDPSSSLAYFMQEGPLQPATGLDLWVDVTWLGPHETGAQVLTTSALRELSLHDGVRSIRLTGVKELPEYARHLVDLPGVIVDQDSSAVPVCDIAWFPNQIDARSDIANARERGRRVVATYLDLIAYDIERYHASRKDWFSYRRLQRSVALGVDGITTISRDVADRLLMEVPKLERDRVKATVLGLDHISLGNVEPDLDIAGLREPLEDKTFVLVLGNDFLHKNRDFAIKVWQKIIAGQTPCHLVLAGLHVKSSSSRGQEADLIDGHVDSRGAVYQVGHVSSASRMWLMKNAKAVLYPSSAEGFGFVPYEAALLGTPSSFVNFGPLAELSGVTSSPKSWSTEEFARDVALLLSNPDYADQRIRELRMSADALTWTRFADELVEFFVRILWKPSVHVPMNHAPDHSTINVRGKAKRFLRRLMR